VSRKLNQQFNCSKMMLPEHRSSLEQQILRERCDRELRYPAFDEQELDRLQQQLDLALANKQPIRVTVLENSVCQIYSGVPLRIDQGTGIIVLSTGCGRRQPIQAAQVVALEQADPQ